MVEWADIGETCPQCGKTFRPLATTHVWWPWWWSNRPYCSQTCRDIVADKDINAILRGQNIADEQDADKYAGA